MNNSAKFIRALSYLPVASREHFWQFIADSLKKIPYDAKFKLALNAALTELRKGRTKPRSGRYIPSEFRQLSKDELRNLILNRREQLIPFVEGCDNWNLRISHWVLFTYTNEMILVLDALGCPHDGQGRPEGRPLELDPEEAMHRIMALSKDIPFTDLEIVVTGLFCNNDGWHYLDKTIDCLHKEAQRTRELADSLVIKDQDPAVTKASKISDDPTARVQYVRELMDDLIQSLESAVTTLRTGRLPDFTTIASTVQPLQAAWTKLITELKPIEPSLPGLTDALDTKKNRAKALALLDRLQCLRHRDKHQFSGILTIRQRCIELRQKIAEATHQDEAITAELKPLYALERLIIEHQILVDEEVIEELDTEVRKHFGPQTAIAAIKGHLEFAELNAVVPAESSETSDLTEAAKHRKLDTKNTRELSNTLTDPVTPFEEVLDINGVRDWDHAVEKARPIITANNPAGILSTPKVAGYSPVSESVQIHPLNPIQQGGTDRPKSLLDDSTSLLVEKGLGGGCEPVPPPESFVATLLKDGLARLGPEDWVQQLGGIQYSWLERRQPLRAWLLASEVERQLTSRQIHIQDSRFLPSWACRLLLAASDAKLLLSDEDKELLYRIRNLSSDSKELIVLWITAALFENATDKPLRIIRSVSLQQFDLPSHSLGDTCVERLLTPVFNGGSLLPLRDPADFQKEFDQAIQKAQEILDKSNNYSNGWVKKFWRDLIARTGRMGQILADARQRRFPARMLSVEVIVEDIPEWTDIKSAYRNNMHNRMEEFANRIEAARSAHQATQKVPQANQSTISKQAIAEILGSIQRQTGNAWWLEVIKSGIAHL